VPEGHTIHRLARLHRRALRGKVVAADSPQGRFAQGAAVLHGQKLDTVEAYGKHLFYRWSGGDTLHVHLGLFGKFRSFRLDGARPTAASLVDAAADDFEAADAEAGGEAGASLPHGLPAATTGTRLRLVAEDVVIHLAGPTACEVIDPAAEERILSRLGPDPLRKDADPEQAWTALRRRTVPLGAALLDQKAIAGIGNVYRAETLFLERINPDRSARQVTREEFDRLWLRVVTLLRAGERSGRIVTVDLAEVGTRSARSLPASERLYVYKRAGLPCRRCGTTILAWELATRTIFACPNCQPR
jgi:endonuclease VIII